MSGFHFNTRVGAPLMGVLMLALTGSVVEDIIIVIAVPFVEGVIEGVMDGMKKQ